MDDLRKFNDVLAALQAAKDSDDGLLQVLETERPFFDAMINRTGPLDVKGEVARWVNVNWPLLNDRQALTHSKDEMADAAKLLRKVLSDPGETGFGQGIPLTQWCENLIQWMERFSKQLNVFLTQMTDESFSYRGLKVSNPDRLPEPVALKLLSGIDYVLALFKKRGVTAVLDETLRAIIIRHQKPHETEHGFYHSQTGEITLMSQIIGSESLKMLKVWVNEVFLHEVGHHVHMKLMDREAAKEWDRGWTDVNKAKEATEEADNKIRKVSHAERQRFWDQLLAGKGDLKKIKLKGLDRMKFHAWLSTPMTGGTILTPKNLQWASDGKWIKTFMEDPEGYISKDYGSDPTNWGPAIERRWRQLKDKFGVADSYANYHYPTLSPEQVKEYAVNDDQVAKALDALEMPTSYARTNEKEDFAETFVAYMDAPEALSKQSRYRMQRALHMSGLAGKPIMKTVAKLVAEAQALLAQ